MRVFHENDEAAGRKQDVNFCLGIFISVNMSAFARAGTTSGARSLYRGKNCNPNCRLGRHSALAFRVLGAGHVCVFYVLTVLRFSGGCSSIFPHLYKALTRSGSYSPIGV